MSELSDDARTLIAQARVGQDDDPSAEDRARMRAKVAAALALTTLSGTAASAALPKTAAAQVASAGLTTKLVVASLVAVTAGAAVVSVRQGSGPSHDAGGASTRPRAALVQSAPPPESPVQPAAAPGSQDAPADQAALPHARKPVPKGAARREASAQDEPSPPPSLQAELSLITAAQEALRTGRPRLALERSSEHAARFPAGALIQERLGIDAIAACTLGERERGLRALKLLARRAPSAPLLARARAACREPDAE